VSNPFGPARPSNHGSRRTADQDPAKRRKEWVRRYARIDTMTADFIALLDSLARVP